MDLRKIQMSGGSSYIVSLPKEWIISNKIGKNDSVGITVQNDGTLLVTPKTDTVQMHKCWECEVSHATDKVFFLRCLIGAYISGHTSIKISAQGKLPVFVMESVREFTNMAIGQEVVDETESYVVIKDLLNPSEMPLSSTIQRMSVIVTKMHQDALIALKNCDSALAENVRFRDNDVDRLHWLVARQSNLIMNNLSLSHKMSVSPLESVYYFLVSRIIERVGDHASRIAGSVINLSESPMPKNLLELIESAGSDALKIFNKSIDAFFSEDIAAADKLIDSARNIDALSREINSLAMNYDTAHAVSAVNISDSIRRIADYSSDICENIINHAVNNTKMI